MKEIPSVGGLRPCLERPGVGENACFTREAAPDAAHLRVLGIAEDHAERLPRRVPVRRGFLLRDFVYLLDIGTGAVDNLQIRKGLFRFVKEPFRLQLRSVRAQDGDALLFRMFPADTGHVLRGNGQDALLPQFFKHRRIVDEIAQGHDHGAGLLFAQTVHGIDRAPHAEAEAGALGYNDTHRSIDLLQQNRLIPPQQASQYFLTAILCSVDGNVTYMMLR